MSLIQRIFGHSDGLLCPRCEQALEGHDEKACGRRMSRRYFFGLGAAAIALGMAPKPASLAKAYAKRKLGERPPLWLGPGDRISVKFGTNPGNHDALISVLLEHTESGLQRVHMQPVPTFKDQTVFIADTNYRIKNIMMVSNDDNIARKPAITVVRG